MTLVLSLALSSRYVLGGTAGVLGDFSFCDDDDDVATPDFDLTLLDDAVPPPAAETDEARLILLDDVVCDAVCDVAPPPPALDAAGVSSVRDRRCGC